MRRVLIVLGCVLSVIPNVGADVIIIYRKSDQLLSAFVRDPKLVENEIRNTTRSDLGGVASDYDTITVSDAAWQACRGKQRSLDAALQLVCVSPAPVPIPPEQFAAIQEMRAKLGLSAQEWTRLRQALGLEER